MSEGDTISPADVTVVIPCMNEAGSLPGVLAAIPPGYRVLVVDNTSTDGTADVARAHGASVVAETRPGYGSAVHAGVEAARTPVVCVLDGDGSMDPRELPTLVAAVESGADLALGRRRAVERGTWPLHSRIGNAVVAARLRRRYGIPVRDLGAMRVVRRQALLDLGVGDRRSGYPLQLLILAGRAHWRITECDITYRPRTAGSSKVSGSVKGTLRAVHDFWRVMR
ncbi:MULTISPECIES: glycosyltransferase family 2 protein [Rhodococcus]|uniref:Glycosyltransferase family 2 protein n=1 Tax=Rhodococcus oxybenzonivorans TaxID=1990687 RepID=A0AAE4V402_9NOCA|nr:MULTISPECIES: glycosyltransferase family 2 protein [Rhodococcus]MDV7242833.1 glycosyltransferase family 2 protein [Rhodococcus oxybenzonivorans]MDV7267837.1 glycosyltransferase family 2 protein [Rhodococcus oxybenzonivorans]MDV7275237.1 glycosyltransferase family 2 protein [Rhodococcus oxybenzonivorans]MDV7334908.1 glycosyltransferase family 2 protein [Rhodococcus oxybenzonivorans]MDV7345062.1 glycosyltransferase family 2 protein [Rhodococcus oxybenzonivorans]